MTRQTLISGALLTLMLAAPTFGADMVIDDQTQTALRQFLLGKFGETQRERIEKGVAQTAALWQERDGSVEEFRKFCKENFIPAGPGLDAAFSRLEANLESLNGHLNKISLDLKRPLHLEMGDIQPIDLLFGQYEPTAHLSDDMFAHRIAFFIALNFPHYSLDEKTAAADKWSRREWAWARLGDLFTARVPARVIQHVAESQTEAETYISAYNIYLGRLLNRSGKTEFPPDLKLISHWGLRDEIKARYADPKGFSKQETIYEVMKRIVQQDIPRPVINNPACDWNPFSNRIFADGKSLNWTPEPNTRYWHLLNTFLALRELDAFTPDLPTHIKRKFEGEREIPKEQVETMFSELLTAPEVRQTAGWVEKRLKRKLHPFDIWFNGFRAGPPVDEAELDRLVARRYPDAKAFERDIRNILLTLGFSSRQAEFVAARIELDPARGAGHAWGAQMKTEKSHLRTRVPATGMNYKGFNIAMHELGHCVEQVLSLHKVDHYLMAGVPNTAFSEAFAFVFQSHDLDILGLKRDDAASRSLRTLDTLWSSYEIMGVALVDMKVWDWLYANPSARPEDLRRSVIAIAKEVWNQYYADILGGRDQVILAVYSHLIDAALYLPDYPLGRLIEFQLERHLNGRNLGAEMERMCAAGRLPPAMWMKNATGTDISVRPLLEAAAEALKKIKP